MNVPATLLLQTVPFATVILVSETDEERQQLLLVAYVSLLGLFCPCSPSSTTLARGPHCSISWSRAQTHSELGLDNIRHPIKQICPCRQAGGG